MFSVCIATNDTILRQFDSMRPLDRLGDSIISHGLDSDDRAQRQKTTQPFVDRDTVPLLTELFRVLEERLAKQLIKSRFLSLALLSSFFRECPDPRHISSLLEDPLRLPDQDLKALFRLRECITYQSSTGTMRYHIRSFSMTVKHLREIFAFMISNSLGYPKLRILFDKTAT